MKRLLIVDSNEILRSQLARAARMDGYEVTEVSDGSAAVSMCRNNPLDFVILDASLPDLNGYSICSTIRSFSQVPILILSEHNDEEHRVRGLELGADDFLAKPVSIRELLLRVANILKRGPGISSHLPRLIQQDAIRIDLAARRVTVDGAEVSLTPKEFDVLTLLAGNPNVVFPRKKILDAVWSSGLPQDTRTLDTHIKQVRRALGPYSDRIVTLRGVGYRFE